MSEVVNLKSTGAYLARPEGNGPFPAVIVIQEWWGLNDNIKEITDKFASEGFLGLAVDLYKGHVAASKEEAQAMVDNLTLEAGLQMCLEAVDYLKSRNDVGKIGVTGFCMGGKYTLLLAGHSSEIAACVPFYGHVPFDYAQGKPSADEHLKGVKCPVLGHYAELDDGIPPTEVQLLKDTLTKYGVDHEIITYPGAHHAFMNDRGDRYDPGSAAKAWEKTMAFFKKNLA